MSEFPNLVHDNSVSDKVNSSISPQRRMTASPELAPLENSPQPSKIRDLRSVEQRRIDHENHHLFLRLNRVTATYKVDKFQKDESDRQKWLENSCKHPYVLSPSRKNDSTSIRPVISPTTRLAPLDSEIARLRSSLENDNNKNTDSPSPPKRSSPRKGFTEQQLATSKPAYFGNGTEESLPVKCVFRSQLEIVPGTIFLVEFWSDSINLDIYVWPIGEKGLPENLVNAARRHVSMPFEDDSIHAVVKRKQIKKGDLNQNSNVMGLENDTDDDASSYILKSLESLSSISLIEEAPLLSLINICAKAENGEMEDVDISEESRLYVLSVFQALFSVCDISPPSTWTSLNEDEQHLKGWVGVVKPSLIEKLRNWSSDPSSSVNLSEESLIAIASLDNNPAELSDVIGSKCVNTLIKALKDIEAAYLIQNYDSSEANKEGELDAGPPSTTVFKGGRTLIMPPHYHLCVSADGYTKLKVTCLGSHSVMASKLTFVTAKDEEDSAEIDSEHKDESSATKVPSPPVLVLKPNPESISPYRVGLEAALSSPEVRLQRAETANKAAQKRSLEVEEKQKEISELRRQLLEKQKRENPSNIVKESSTTDNTKKIEKKTTSISNYRSAPLPLSSSKQTSESATNDLKGKINNLQNVNISEHNTTVSKPEVQVSRSKQVTSTNLSPSKLNSKTLIPNSTKTPIITSNTTNRPQQTMNKSNNIAKSAANTAPEKPLASNKSVISAPAAKPVVKPTIKSEVKPVAKIEVKPVVKSEVKTATKTDKSKNSNLNAKTEVQTKQKATPPPSKIEEEHKSSSMDNVVTESDTNLLAPVSNPIPTSLSQEEIILSENTSESLNKVVDIPPVIEKQEKEVKEEETINNSKDQNDQEDTLNQAVEELTEPNDSVVTPGEDNLVTLNTSSEVKNEEKIDEVNKDEEKIENIVKTDDDKAIALETEILTNIDEQPAIVV